MCALDACIAQHELRHHLGLERCAGPLILMIVHIAYEIKHFLAVMAVVILAFSTGFYLLYQPTLHSSRADAPDIFRTFEASLATTFLMLLGSFDNAVELFQGDAERGGLAMLLFSLYQILALLILLNMLIAIMGDTFERMKVTKELNFWKGRCAS